MTVLAANIDATQTLISVDAGLTNGSFQLPLYYTVDSEAVRVIGRAHRTTWLVERGIAGTTAATHSSAATLTRYYPDGATGEGGGAVSVDNTVDPPAEVTTIIAPGADVSTPGEATLSADLLVVERTLTAVEIHTLNSVPVVLVEGVPNTVIMPGGGWLVYHDGPSGFVNASPLLLGTATLNTNALPWFDEGVGAAIMTQLVDSVSPWLPKIGGGIRELAWAEGEDLTVQMDSADPDPAPDGDGTLDVVVFYRVVSV